MSEKIENFLEEIHDIKSLERVLISIKIDIKLHYKIRN